MVLLRETLEPPQELLDPGLVGIELERAGEAAPRRVRSPRHR